MAALRASGVDVTMVRRSERPTPVAIVDLSGPEPIYRITDVGRVLHDIVPPDPPPGTRCLVVGSAVLAHQPVAGAIEALCARAPVLAIDYNVRQPSITDAAAYTARLERLSRRAGIVKASVADLAMIGEADGPAYMRRMVREGAALAVLTDGPRGAHAWSGAASASVPAPAVEVIDSVGAGDAFMAALLAALQAEDALSHEALGALGGETLECHLVMAQRVAAASCTKRGAHMPFAAELCL
ncbi:PfkB family carbohydrate kinase [Acuticoccus sp.]|uniref:PfkB family carbohydrate kinase n=1 Tax=Acuticoccus sp. TaxID=1904378 RepID=UPI003B52B3DF